ncbi:MAG: flagellar hook-length control protein FliK [Tissierellaceae bacterium]
MKIENIQVSNMDTKFKPQGKGKGTAMFSEVLSNIMDNEGQSKTENLDLESDIVDIVEDVEEDNEENSMEIMSLGLNMIFPISREDIENVGDLGELEQTIALDEIQLGDIPLGVETEEISQRENLILDEGEVTPFMEELIIQDSDIFQDSDITLTSQESNLDLESMDIVEDSMPSLENVKLGRNSVEEQVPIQRDEISNRATSTVDKAADMKIEEDISLDDGRGIKSFRDFNLEEKEVQIEDNKFKAIPMEKDHVESMTSKVNLDLQQNTLSRENMEIVNHSIMELVESVEEKGTSTIKIKLHPEEFGSVDITLSMDEGKLIAKILVDNDHVKQLFARSMEELNQNLLKQDIHIGDVHVDLNNNSNGEQHNSRNHFKAQKGLGFNTGFKDDVVEDRSILESGAISILA